ncbi:MAG: DNRLRE domain-containing protein [Phycisphaerae bacterium]
MGLRLAALLGCMAASAWADSVSLVADRDNSLFQTVSTIDASNGAGIYLYSGLTSGESRRRALVHFNVAAVVPTGSTINSATVTLWSDRSITAPHVFTLHRITTAWGEGESDAGDPGGTGAESAPGDASWNYAVFPTDLWATEGGDFVATASASDTIEGRNEYSVYGPTVGLAADVQAWVDGSAANHGWMLLGNEGSPSSAYRFYSRENASAIQRPTLMIDFTPPAPCVGDLNNDGSIGLTDLSILLANFGATGGAAQGDINNDGQITLSDLAALLAVFGNDC